MSTFFSAFDLFFIFLNSTGTLASILIIKKCLGYVDLLTQIIETINFSPDVQEFIEVNNSVYKHINSMLHDGIQLFFLSSLHTNYIRDN